MGVRALADLESLGPLAAGKWGLCLAEVDEGKRMTDLRLCITTFRRQTSFRTLLGPTPYLPQARSFSM